MGASDDSMDFDDLNYEDFELLVGLLLVREGFVIKETPPGRGVRGPDFQVVDEKGIAAIVEVKHFRHSKRVPLSALAEFLDDVDRRRQQFAGVLGMLVTSFALTGSASDVVRARDGVVLWDGSHVQALLVKHPDVAVTADRLRQQRLAVTAQMESLKKTAAEPSLSIRLTSVLAGMKPGRSDWRAFEESGTRALTQIFEPHLGPPEVHNRTDDGLDIMDAIFPIRSSSAPWSVVRAEYRSRFIVAEYKNHEDYIGQREVESIQQYLWSKAHRSFGLLVSRRGPNQSAVAARRRAWVAEEKMVVFLSDEDLIYMAQLREEGGDPFEVIDRQLEEFLRHLNP
jgi:hypothetical protein